MAGERRARSRSAVHQSRARVVSAARPDRMRFPTTPSRVHGAGGADLRGRRAAAGIHDPDLRRRSDHARAGGAAASEVTPQEPQGIAITLMLELGADASLAMGPMLTLALDGTLDLGSGLAAILRPDRDPKIMLDPGSADRRP